MSRRGPGVGDTPAAPDGVGVRWEFARDSGRVLAGPQISAGREAHVPHWAGRGFAVGVLAGCLAVGSASAAPQDAKDEAALLVGVCDIEPFVSQQGDAWVGFGVELWW